MPCKNLKTGIQNLSRDSEEALPDLSKEAEDQADVPLPLAEEEQARTGHPSLSINQAISVKTDVSRRIC